jgi:WD40 repeat protein
MKSRTSAADGDRTGRYDAFISYHRGPDSRLAEGVRTALHRLAKPWYRLRALSVFLDRASLAAGTDLPSAIKNALLQSEYLIVIASQEASRAPWVDREVSFWIENKGTERVLIVLADGAVSWSETQGGFVQDERNPLPRSLCGALTSEPHYIDLSSFRQEREPTLRDPSFRDGIASLAARLHGRSKDALIGDDVRLLRQARRLATAGSIVLAVLAVGASTAAYFAASNLGRALFNQGDAAFRAGRYEDARAAYMDARRWLGWTLQPTLAVNAALAYQDRVAVSPVAILDAHAPRNPVAAISPNGRWVLVAGDDGVLKRADREADSAFEELGRDSDWITAIAISRDSRSALTAGRDGFVKLWDLEQGKERLPPLKASDLAVWSVAVSPDGQTALSGGDDRKVRVWDLESGTLKTTLADRDHAHLDWIAALGFSDDGNKAFSASRDGAIKIWNVHDWSFAASFGSTGRLTSAAITADGARVIAVDEQGEVHIWDADSGEEVKTIPPSAADLARVVALVPEYRLGIMGGAFGGAARAFIGGGGGSLALWDLRTGERVQEFEGHRGAVRTLSLSDGDVVVSASDDGTVRLWPAQPPGPKVSVDALAAGVVALHPADSRIFASGGAEGQVSIWDSTTNELLRTLWPRGDAVKAVSFDPGRDSVLLVREDGTVSIGSIMANEPEESIKLDGPVATARACPNTGAFVALLTNGIVIRYTQGEATEPIKTGLKEIGVYAISADCQRVATGKYGDPVTIWDLGRGEKISTIGVAPFGFLTAAFVGDGNRILLGSADSSIELWEVEKPQKFWTSAHLLFQPSALAAAKSGELALAGDEGGKVHVVDLRTGEILRSYSGHEGKVLSLSLDAFGEHGVSGGYDGIARIWSFYPAAASTPQDPQLDRALMPWMVGKLKMAYSELSGLKTPEPSDLYDRLLSEATQRDIDARRQQDPNRDLADYWSFRAMGNHLFARSKEKVDYASAGVRHLGWTVDPYLDRASARIEAGDLVGAVSDCSAALALLPSDPSILSYIYQLRARALQELGWEDRALRDYGLALEFDKSNYEPFNNRGNIYFHRGDNDRAIAEYSRGIAVASDQPLLWLHRGWARLNNGDIQGAHADVTRSHELADKTEDKSLLARADHGMGLVLLVMGDLPGARRNFDESIQLSDASDSKVGRGVTDLAAGRWQQAIDDFESIGSLSCCRGLLILARAQLDRQAAMANLSALSASHRDGDGAIAEALAVALSESQSNDPAASGSNAKRPNDPCVYAFYRGATEAIARQVEPALESLRDAERECRPRSRVEYLAASAMLHNVMTSAARANDPSTSGNITGQHRRYPKPGTSRAH